MLNLSHFYMQYISGPVLAISNNCYLQQEFLPNIVCLDISRLSLLNLSFYNLLGVINQTKDGIKLYPVKLVKNFVKDYIKSKNALILRAYSMEGDICNFSTFKILHNLKAEHRYINEPLYLLYRAPLARLMVSFIY